MCKQLNRGRRQRGWSWEGAISEAMEMLGAGTQVFTISIGDGLCMYPTEYFKYL